MLLALREAVESRPVRTVRALFLRAKDAAPKVLETLGRAPSRGREERVRGLDGAVTIARDAFGVPGVFGGSLADVAFGMGYACAEDRLFQMDLMRVALRGELASVLGARPVDDALPFRLPRGATLVDLDAFTRALGFRGAAEASYAIASAEARAWLDAYAAGVNAFVATGRRPLESLLLDLEPGPFTAVDSLLIGKGVAFQLGFAWRFALTYARIAGVVSADKLRALLPTHPLTVTAGAADAIEPVLLHARMLADVLGTEGLHLGSNAFALAAHRTSIGRPIVASDPHMPLHAPAVLWEVRLRGGGIDARGATIPGVPGLPIGQNAHAAWGMTAGWGDDSQVWREDLGALRTAGRLEVTHETIAVRGGDSRTVPVVRTPRGPIVSGATGDEQAIALRWCGDTASLETDGSLALLRARDFDDLRAAARLHSAPTLNFVFADREGHLGVVLGGSRRAPPRPGGHEPRPARRRGPAWPVGRCDPRARAPVLARPGRRRDRLGQHASPRRGVPAHPRRHLRAPVPLRAHPGPDRRAPRPAHARRHRAHPDRRARFVGHLGARCAPRGPARGRSRAPRAPRPRGPPPHAHLGWARRRDERRGVVHVRLPRRVRAPPAARRARRRHLRALLRADERGGLAAALRRP